MDLQTLIEDVRRRAGSDDPLEQLAEAIRQHAELIEQAEHLLDHFVQAARSAGCSWAQVGSVLGVTKQAAQQRHSRGPGIIGWLRGRVGKGMFAHFTDRARAVATGSQDAARDLGHDHVGTEHILLALLANGDSVGAKAVASWNITYDQVRDEVIARVGRGDGSPSGHIPFTPRSKKVLELSLREALSLGHNYIGTEHILLGLLRAQDGVGAAILRDRGVTMDAARKTVIDILAGYTLRDGRDEST